MDPKEDDEISIDFGKIKKFFKSDNVEKRADGSAKDHPVKEHTEDDEISIDFGRMKSWFKQDEKEVIKAEPQENSKSDDEVSIDFGKIKKFFKSEGQEHTDKDEEISINWSKVGNFLKKYGVIFIALIPIILSIYIHMQTESLQITDGWAANNVISTIRSQIRSGIDQQYPNLPDANKNQLVDSELQKVISKNSAQIDQQVKGTSDYIKAFFQDESKKMYMPDIDPYYWYRYAKNILDHGHPGDVIKDGKPFDTHQLAPLGRFVSSDMFHPYFLAYFYKFIHFFAPDLTLMRTMFYYPVLVSALCVLLTFLIARKIAGNFGGFFAASMMAVNAAFLGRTLSPDNDAWNIFFSLIVTWLILEALQEKNAIKLTILTLFGGLFTALFILEWSGWWFIFDFLLATIGFAFLYQILANVSKLRNLRFVFSDKDTRNILIIGVIFFLSTAIFVTMISNFAQFRNSFLGPLSFPSIKAPVQSNLWPNVFTTVAELNEGSIDGIINSVGGQFLFFISLIGLIFSMSRHDGLKKFDFMYIFGSIAFYASYFLFRKIGISISFTGFVIWIMLPVVVRIIISIYKKDSSYDFKLSILLTLWIISTIFASIKGIRFTVLLAPAFCVAFGVALGKVYSYSSRYLSKELKIHTAITSGVLILVLLVAYISPTVTALGAARSNLPLINDAWYNSLIAIKQNSSQNAIITSWWDFGHHFKAIADRSVTFDGTTQTSEAAHWVGALLMTSSEEQSVGMLRMLDCGHNNAYNELIKINKSPYKSLKVLDEIIILDKADAKKKLLLQGLTSLQADSVLQYTHCDPPEAYFIASDDMIGKSGVWSHFGAWNFERAELWQNVRKMPQEQAVNYMILDFNYTKDKAESVYFEMQSITTDKAANDWVAPWPSYGGVSSCGKTSEKVYSCGDGLQINLSNYDVFAQSQQGVARPKSVAFTTESGILKKDLNSSSLDFGITVVPKNDNEVEMILSSKELTGSIFTRMFYMQGHGLRYYKLVNHQRGLTGTDIYVYKVDWQGRDKNIVKEYFDFFNPKKAPIAPESAKTNETLAVPLDGTSNTTNATNSS